MCAVIFLYPYSFRGIRWPYFLSGRLYIISGLDVCASQQFFVRIMFREKCHLGCHSKLKSSQPIPSPVLNKTMSIQIAKPWKPLSKVRIYAVLFVRRRKEVCRRTTIAQSICACICKVYESIRFGPLRRPYGHRKRLPPAQGVSHEIFMKKEQWRNGQKLFSSRKNDEYMEEEG
jgi:hypothetical protein